MNGISMSGKTVLITGATSGLGLATALLLAEQGAEVVMVGRDRERGNFMRGEIGKYASGSSPILFLADLSSRLGDDMRGLPAALPWIVKRIPSLLTLPERAAGTPVYVASSPDFKGVSGKFFLRGRKARTKPISYDAAVAGRLWNISEALYHRRAALSKAASKGIFMEAKRDDNLR